tara:strand:- start:101 stop:1654 length:1554 start_codon:yes stop_codon:yes gene_type:complete
LNANKFEINGQLDIEDCFKLMHSEGATVVLSERSLDSIDQSRKRLESFVSSNDVVYGVNTGFGSLANVRIDESQLRQLQVNLIRSHCVGVGPDFSEQIVRGILLLRANTLAQGYSGVRPIVVQTLLSFLNSGIYPCIPEIGSLGASGDLAPLAHMSLSLIGEGKVSYKGSILDSSVAMSTEKIKPLELVSKEGLALINGTPVMCAMAVECLVRLKNLLKYADVVSTLSLEALSGTDKGFQAAIHRIRPHAGQQLSARNVYAMLQGSPNRTSHLNCDKVQDAYSLRCIPQVHGACYDAFKHAWDVIGVEINSVTDNPIVLEDEIVSGGNFHGEPVSMVMSYLNLAICELGSISERRQNRLVNHNLSHLPAFLVKESGLNSGMMIAHYTSAACVSENRCMAFPPVVDSISTSADQEDHVSMGVTAARHCLKTLDNLESILSIETLIACQGLEFISNPLSPALSKVVESVREWVAPLEADRNLSPDIESIRKLILDGTLVKIVENEIGDLMHWPPGTRDI